MNRSPEAYAASLKRRVAAFWRANPDEQLTLADMEIKFDCTAAQARRACYELVAEGFKQKRDILYTLTPPPLKP